MVSRQIQISLLVMTFFVLPPAVRADTIRLEVYSVEATDQTVFGQDQGPIISVKMTPKSQMVFSHFTKLRTGEIVDIRIGSRIISSPRIVEPITGGRILISGFRDKADAYDALKMLGSRDAVLEVDGSDK